MSLSEIMPRPPYEGKTVYYSGSIKGQSEADPQLPWKIVQFMGERGADVLSEHVAARNQEEMDQIRARRIGLKTTEFHKNPAPWYDIRRQDMDWVDDSQYIVALVNAASTGVGTEIQRAIDWWDMRGVIKPTLSLVHVDQLERLSYMIRGIRRRDHPAFYLRTYRNFTDITLHINRLFTQNPV